MSMSKQFWKKLWWFLWEDNSIWSWIANIILAFVIIKFIFYPAAGFVLGTSHPIVAVVSGSMEHPGGFDNWWGSPSCCANADCSEKIPQGELYEKLGINQIEFKQFPFKNGFNKGDIMILWRPANIAIGDILVFRADNRLDPIIHRVVAVDQLGDHKSYLTKGDHNCGSADFERAVRQENQIGKALFRIPFLGWIKIGFVELLKVSGVV